MDEYVSLKNRYNRGKKEYSTIGSVMECFEDLGFCMNWALLTKVDDNPCLNYQGWIYNNSPISSVALPFPCRDNPDFGNNFQNLLWEIFKPFLYAGELYLHRSYICVNPAPKEENCYFVDMFLIFKGGLDFYEEIRSSLDAAKNAPDECKTIAFWLD